MKTCYLFIGIHLFLAFLAFIMLVLNFAAPDMHDSVLGFLFQGI